MSDKKQTLMEPQRIHFLSDFNLILDEIAWPDHDWHAKFFTNDHHSSYEASIKNGVGTNCFNDNGKIHVVFNNHNLGPGRLIMITSDEWPNEIYPDGIQHLVDPHYRLNAELVAGHSNITEMHCEVQPPYIKGEKGDPGVTGAPGKDGRDGADGAKGEKGEKGDAFLYSDFTAEQLASLKGDKGEKGDAGTPGKDGKNGVYLGLPVVVQSETSVTIVPDVLNHWGEVSELSIDFAPAKEGYAGEYCIEFTSPAASPTTLSLPDSVQFPEDPVIEAGMRYQISVVNNVGLIAGVAV